MADKYVVYVAAPSESPPADARLRLAELLGLDLPKLDTLLARLPAEVTKPVPESTAVTVARRFREAGLEASIRAPQAAEPSGGATDPDYLATDETDSSFSPDENSNRNDSWAGEFGSPPSRDADEEDELFPPSSFTRTAGVKAPSKPLVIALIVVLAILVALWILL